MVARRPAILLAVLLLGVALVGGAVALGSPEPVVTIENGDNVSYRVTAYTVEDTDEAGYLNFEVTTDDGDRRLVTYADLVWPSGYRNVTPVDDDVNSQSFVVEANETTTESVEGWSAGDVTVYVIERGANRTHTRSRTIDCGKRGQEHGFEFTDESDSSGSTLCANGIGWVFE